MKITGFPALPPIPGPLAGMSVPGQNMTGPETSKRRRSSIPSLLNDRGGVQHARGILEFNDILRRGTAIAGAVCGGFVRVRQGTEA